MPRKPRAKEIRDSSSAAIAIIEAKHVVIHDDLLNALPNRILKFTATTNREAYFNPSTNEIVLGSMSDRERSNYFCHTVIAHEIGHAIHYNKRIITETHVRQKFANHFLQLQGLISGKEIIIHNALLNIILTSTDQDSLEQIGTIADILGSLTKGAFGFGHSVNYYQNYNGAEAEIFAHSVSLFKMDNLFSNITREMKQVIEEMKKFVRNLL